MQEADVARRTGSPTRRLAMVVKGPVDGRWVGDPVLPGRRPAMVVKKAPSTGNERCEQNGGGYPSPGDGGERPRRRVMGSLPRSATATPRRTDGGNAGQRFFFIFSSPARNFSHGSLSSARGVKIT
jgi:hypothetical protein